MRPKTNPAGGDGPRSTQPRFKTRITDEFRAGRAPGVGHMGLPVVKGSERARPKVAASSRSQHRSHGQSGLVCMLLAMLHAAAPALAPAPVAATTDGLLADPRLADAIAIEDFARYSLGTFPKTWRIRGSTDSAEVVYRVARDNGTGAFLAARAEGRSVMIGLDRQFEPVRYPYLRWRWRVHAFPSGGDERDQATNDSAAGVYVIFPGRLPFLPRALKYVWSTSAPVGLRQPSPMYNDTKIIVVASGPTNEPEQWRTETVNVRQDYEALFGREAPTARGIGLLTDADATHSVAAADYTDFQLLKSVQASPDDAHGGGDEPPASPPAD